MTAIEIIWKLAASLFILAMFLAFPPADSAAQETNSRGSRLWDTYSDTWAATDALGRSLPGYAETGPPRANKFVGIFYFLWLGEHGTDGPFDVTKILARDPQAINNPDSPLWGPLGSPHHWGEPAFGYYVSDDEWVLRKHAQMLSDAGVDAVFFDVTNQLTYPRSYLALCRVWTQIRREGGKTPQIAFLAPFWNPVKVVQELYGDFYQQGLYADLWFRWEGKPLILADPDAIQPERLRASQRVPGRLQAGDTAGQSFTAKRPFTAVGGEFPTYHATTSGMTLTLRRKGPGGEVLARRRFNNVVDNATVLLETPRALPPGTYYLEQGEPKGQIGWWSETGEVYAAGRAFSGGMPAAGDRSLTIRYAGEAKAVALTSGDRKMTPEAAGKLAEAIRRFFTFRKPQPDYFTGPTGPGQWGWLDVHPQKAYFKTPGVPEQVTVGVAQNAVDGRLGALSNPRAQGRSFAGGKQPGPSGQDFTGRNFAEQWKHARQIDPSLVFVTGWNEWVAGRFAADAPFHGAGSVTFVDTFNHEYSRDIEPVRGGHTDNYYYQLVDNIRRFKGVRVSRAAATASRTMPIDGDFREWEKWKRNTAMIASIRHIATTKAGVRQASSRIARGAMISSV